MKAPTSIPPGQSVGEKPLDPYKTICVLKTESGREVGRIPAAAPNAEAYITEMVRQYGSIHVDYEEDPTGGLLYALHRRN